MALHLKLPPRGTLIANGESDPLRFYYLPLVGRVFTARIDAGLGLLEGRFSRLLEIGYGSGLLMPTLTAVADELYGADIAPEPPGLRDTLARQGAYPKQLVQADIQQMPFSDGFFDGIVAFSILEHLKAPELVRAGAELARVLAPRGQLIVGCPAVHPIMNAAFAAIGFPNIGEHHFSGLPDVLTALAPHFTVEARTALPRAMKWAPLGWAPYGAVRLRRR